MVKKTDAFLLFIVYTNLFDVDCKRSNCATLNHATFWNKPVLSEERKVCWSRRQREHLMELKPRSDGHPLITNQTC